MDLTGAVLAASVSVAFVHTAVGVDHYLPFIVLGRAERWSLSKTLLWTGVCGLGHVLSSVVLAFGAAALGMATGQLAWVESARGDLAAYLLIAFGALYLLFGLLFGKGHAHVHAHADGTTHVHPHSHAHGQTHEHHRSAHLLTDHRSLWALFLVFVLGPCEPLMALLFSSGLHQRWAEGIVVALLFSAVTMATMLALVTMGYLGLGVVRLRALERWGHSLAGLAVAASGVLVLFGF